MIKLGCHVSNSGDKMLLGSVIEANQYGANCFMVYLGAPQNSYRKPISAFKVPEFYESLKKEKIELEDIIIHAPYIINFAQPDIEKRQYAINFLVNEIKIASEIGLKYIVIHPGAHVGQGIDNGLELIANSLQQVIERTLTTNVIICLETMAGKGTECCSKFSEIATILKLVNSNRLQVCFDTCHVWDSGYDIVTNYEAVLNEFDSLIGLEKIKVIHLNDSKNFLGSHKDRHENIGFGQIGFETLSKFVYDSRFSSIIKILETPFLKNGQGFEIPPYRLEIAMLKNNLFDNEMISKIVTIGSGCS